MSTPPQFSLLTLLMVMTIVALAIVAYREHFVATQLVAELEQANHALVDTQMCRGAFKNYPPHLFVAMNASLSANLPQNRQHYPLGFRAWHVHIPTGRRARVSLLWNDIADAKTNFSRRSDEHSLILEAGPHALSFYVFRDSAGRWNYRLASTNQKFERKLTLEESEWLGKTRMVRDPNTDPDVDFWNDVGSGPYELGGGITYGVSMGKLTLWTVRYPPPGSPMPKSNQPTNGFAILMEEEPVKLKLRIQHAGVENR